MSHYTEYTTMFINDVEIDVKVVFTHNPAEPYVPPCMNHEGYEGSPEEFYIEALHGEFRDRYDHKSVVDITALLEDDRIVESVIESLKEEKELDD